MTTGAPAGYILLKRVLEVYHLYVAMRMEDNGTGLVSIEKLGPAQ